MGEGIAESFSINEEIRIDFFIPSIITFRSNYWGK